MKSSTRTVLETTLVLNLEEAAWLRAHMQNPLHDESLEEEDPINREFREKFFRAVEHVL